MSDIYSIYKVTNTVNGKNYVGFTKDYKRRKQEHLREARRGKRKYPLYCAINKYGTEVFEWNILYQSKALEYTLSWAEPHFILEYLAEAPLGYNTAKGGTAPMLGKKHSAETVAKMKLRVPWNKGGKFSEESRRKMSVGQRNKKPNPTAWKNQAKANSSYWLVTSPDGVEHRIRGLSKFCKLHRLSRGNMSRLASGGIKYYKGYKCTKLGKLKLI